MLAYVIRRLLISIPIIVISSVLVFVMVSLAVDPLGDLRVRPGVTEQQVRNRAHQLGLDRPIHERYFSWVSGVVRGDLGKSLRTQEDVFPLLMRRVGVTLRLITAATLLAVIVAVVLGVVQAIRQYSRFDYAATLTAFIFFSLPVFWLAALLKDLGIRLNQAMGQTVFFTIGEQTPNLTGNFLGVMVDRVGHLLLPTITLVLVGMAPWSRFQRSGMLEVLNSDYIRTAHAKGLPAWKVIFRHALRNALIPVVTVVAIDFGAIFGGAVITETVYAWQGMGRMLLDALTFGDVIVAQAWLLITAVMVILFNLIADILYAFLDPRIRHA